MNYQTRYTGSSKKKILFRMLTVLICVIIIAVATVIYGNYLKSKAEKSAGESYSGAGRPVETEANDKSDSIITDIEKSVSVKSACIIPERYADETKLAEAITRYASNGYTGITVVMSGSDGYLTYASDAVAEYTKQKPGAGKTLSFINSAVNDAKSKSLRTTAIIYAQSDAFDDSKGLSTQIDRLVCADCASCGFDEIIVMCPISAETVDSDKSNDIVRYLTSLGETKGSSSLGIAFTTGIYTTPSLSPHIELFGSYADFLAIDISSSFSDTDTATSSVKSIADSISGSFSVYGLRSILNGYNGDISYASVLALRDAGYENYNLIGAPEEAVETDAETDTDGQPDGQAAQNDTPAGEDTTAADDPSI